MTNSPVLKAGDGYPMVETSVDSNGYPMVDPMVDHDFPELEVNSSGEFPGFWACFGRK